MSAIRLDVVAKKSARPSAPKVPKAYGKMLVDRAKAELGLDRSEVADFAGISDVTAWRIETGHVDGSVKAANAMREVLLRNGLDVPPVPVGATEWEPPRPAVAVLKNPDEERIRQNLVRFREAIGIDQFAAAHLTGIAYETLVAYELGEQVPPSSTLVKIAERYGCRPGDFFEAELPEFDLDRVPGAWYGGPATKNMTAEERETVERVLSTVTERTRAQKKELGKHIDKAKKRK